MTCDYCKCHRSAHSVCGVIVGGNFQSLAPAATPSVAPDSAKKTFVSASTGRLPVLTNKAMAKAERVQIFRSSVRSKVIDCTSPDKPDTSSSSTPLQLVEPAKKRKKAASPALERVAYKNPDEWKTADVVTSSRNLVVSWHTPQDPDFTGHTDVDIPAVFRLNGEVWFPPVSEKQEVSDFYSYCFTCFCQLKKSGRAECSSCLRYCFTECGGYYNHLKAIDFTCCFCSRREELREYLHHIMDTMGPPSSRSLIDFST